VKLASVRNTKDACFLSYVEDRSKYYHIHKSKHDHIQTQKENMFITVELLYGIWGKKEKKRE
jgi:hypothetical protein